MSRRSRLSATHGRRILLVHSATVAVLFMLVCGCVIGANTNNEASATPPTSSRAAFLRAQRASRQQNNRQQQTQQSNQTTTSNNTSNSVAATYTNQPTHSASLRPLTGVGTAALETTVSANTFVRPAGAGASVGTVQSRDVPVGSSSSSPSLVLSAAQNSNRTARTADIFQNGDGYNIFVTNTCERDLMHVNIKTSRPFHGVIHTRSQRQKPACTVEGNGDIEYNLDISHVLNAKDPAHCGVIRSRKDSPNDKDLLSVVLAVRFHKTIELSDDKFFLLNCTNRCTRPDCSSSKADLQADPERETEDGSPDKALARPGNQSDGNQQQQDECTLTNKFPWVVSLLISMAIIILAMLISLCVVCSSVFCKCVKTEVEEREPSIYEGATTDDEDNLYNKRDHPLRIDYDNRDIYKTSNNYEPYTLDQLSDFEQKSRKSKSSTHRSRR